jgi:ankyrin repeat protein
MCATRLHFMRIIFVFSLFCLSGRIHSQSTALDGEYYDTSSYIPSDYEGALDYNLMIAASKGYTLEITRLIERGADISSETDEGVTPLVFAVSNNQTEVAKMLIDYGSDVNKLTSKYETPLLIAVKNQNEEIAEALIRTGADIDFTDKRYDATPLHYASIYGYFQLVDLLLYYDASIDKKTVEGSTPLLASIWAKRDDIADLLIQNGANMEARDNEGFTPFLMAALNGDTLMMDLLYKKGVDIYATNASNHNALTLTIIADRIEAVAYLLKIGDKWANQENHDLNPYSVASKSRRKDIIKILEDNKIPGKLRNEIDQVDIMVSSRFSINDIYTGASLSFKEPYLNGGIILGCDTKLWYTRILLKQSEHLFYQYMDKGSVVYAGLFKDFALTDNAFRGNYDISASLLAGYDFGNKLKGTLIAPENKFMVIPSVSMKWTKKNLSFSLGADYLKSEFYHVGPVWLRFGVSYNLFFDNIRTKGKTLKWY